jgi:hypothetical protein
MALLAWLLAWLLAALHAATGIGKLLDLPGFVAVLTQYRLLPAALLWPAAVGVVGVELGIALGLVLPRWQRRAALAAAGLAAFNGAVMVLTLGRGIALENCGCFGVFLARPLRWTSPLEDLALMVLALLLARRAA